MLTLVLFVSCPNKWPNACEYLCERKPYSDFTYGEHQDLIFRMIFFFLPESLWRSKFLFKMSEHMFCKEKCELALVHQTVGDTQVYLIADFSSFQKRARASPSSLQQPQHHRARQWTIASQNGRAARDLVSSVQPPSTVQRASPRSGTV